MLAIASILFLLRYDIKRMLVVRYNDELSFQLYGLV